MLQIEAGYAFRKQLNEVHRKNRRNTQLKSDRLETVVDNSWGIVMPQDAGELLTAAAIDLQEYFQISMGTSLPFKDVCAKEKMIRLELHPEVSSKPRSFLFEVKEKEILIWGSDPAGVAQGCYYIEDLMNLREAPYLKQGRELREPLFSPRMIHSGWGLDQFPDAHLNAIAHAGFDSILLFVKGPGVTTYGFMDFNDLIDRCSKYGLGVYFYSYLPSFKHPDDPGAEAFFEQSYGEIFRQSPKAKGLILVGESCGFPSRDERTTGKERPSNIGDKRESGITTGDGFSGSVDHRPSPGFFPCRDYPQWLNAVKKAVHRYAPEADIVFWTYNWGRIAAGPRLELIRNLPKDVTLQATFEMFDTISKYPAHQMVQPDYSITNPGPGFYFRSEAEEAKKQGLKLYSMTNTAGRTWDFGVVPYVPVPQQWIRRFRALQEAHRKWGLSGIMDSHHYGWYPSEISECAKWSFWTPKIDPEEILLKIAQRDFGKAAAPEVIKAWEFWSKAIDSYTPGFDDQAGPLRVGPAYPLIFQPILYPHAEQKMSYPSTPCSAVGARWLHPFYQPEHIYGMTNCGRRIPEDVRIMSRALQIWHQGSELMRSALLSVPPEKYAGASKAAGVGFFCERAIQTMIHVKKWWLLNKKLEIEYDFDQAAKLMDEMENLVDAEYHNVEETIPLTQADSRLGWEPSMDYIGGTWHLQWKLFQLENLRQYTLPAYRRSLSLKPDMDYGE